LGQQRLQQEEERQEQLNKMSSDMESLGPT